METQNAENELNSTETLSYNTDILSTIFLLLQRILSLLIIAFAIFSLTKSFKLTSETFGCSFIEADQKILDSTSLCDSTHMGLHKFFAVIRFITSSIMTGLVIFAVSNSDEISIGYGKHPFISRWVSYSKHINFHDSIGPFFTTLFYLGYFNISTFFSVYPANKTQMEFSNIFGENIFFYIIILLYLFALALTLIKHLAGENKLNFKFKDLSQQIEHNKGLNIANGICHSALLVIGFVSFGYAFSDLDLYGDKKALIVFRFIIYLLCAGKNLLVILTLLKKSDKYFPSYLYFALMIGVEMFNALEILEDQNYQIALVAIAIALFFLNLILAIIQWFISCDAENFQIEFSNSMKERFSPESLNIIITFLINISLAIPLMLSLGNYVDPVSTTLDKNSFPYLVNWCGSLASSPSAQNNLLKFHSAKSLISYSQTLVSLLQFESNAIYIGLFVLVIIGCKPNFSFKSFKNLLRVLLMYSAFLFLRFDDLHDSIGAFSNFGYAVFKSNQLSVSSVALKNAIIFVTVALFLVTTDLTFLNLEHLKYANKVKNNSDKNEEEREISIDSGDKDEEKSKQKYSLLNNLLVHALLFLLLYLIFLFLTSAMFKIRPHDFSGKDTLKRMGMVKEKSSGTCEGWGGGQAKEEVTEFMSLLFSLNENLETFTSSHPEITNKMERTVFLYFGDKFGLFIPILMSYLFALFADAFYMSRQMKVWLYALNIVVNFFNLVFVIVSYFVILVDVVDMPFFFMDVVKEKGMDYFLLSEVMIIVVMVMCILNSMAPIDINDEKDAGSDY